MGKIDNTLRRNLAADPERSVALIIRTAGDPTPHLPRLAELGLQVSHQFRLVPGVSVAGRARAALSLLDEEWIIKIEEDRPVKTM
jgi:hypothetical protein